MVVSILNLFKESVEYNIASLLPRLNLKAVTGSAFCQARYKIKLDFFKDLNAILINYNNENNASSWKGYRLIAGDGSTVSLPASPKIKEHFGVYSESEDGAKCSLAQLFMFFDVGSRSVLASRISGMGKSEKTLFNDCLDELPGEKSIILLDRGFGYFNIFKRLISQKREFCIRMRSSGSNFANLAMVNPSNDFITEWEPSVKERQTCKSHGQDSKSISVRVVKVILKTGEIELLICSPGILSLSAYDIATLYSMRWGIEEGFKKLKPKMKLEYFGSRRPEGILQEFEAHIFMMNLVALFGIVAQETVVKRTRGRQLSYTFNWQNAFRLIREKIVEIMLKTNLRRVVDDLITKISRSVVSIRPERSFPRIEVRKNKTRLHQTYK